MVAPSSFNFSTGPASLPDVGQCAYNGITFSPLFTTSISGKVIKDEARRTTKLIEYRLTVDGYVTLQTGNTNINTSVQMMRRLLQQQGKALTYSGRGFDLLPSTLDVVWGPSPELIEFQPLGGGLSAKVKWEVVFRTPDVPPGSYRPKGFGPATRNPLLQFNYETSLTYGEDYYSSMVIKGTMEIPLNRVSRLEGSNSSGANYRVALSNVDQVRQELDKRIFRGIDLSRFYVTRRVYHVSRDKRTMEFDIQIDEKPYMDMPPHCTIARGSYNVRPAKSGPGLVLWLCTLRATYTIAGNQPRRWAWDSFLLLLKRRMDESTLANIPAGPNQNNQNRQNPQNPGNQVFRFGAAVLTAGASELALNFRNNLQNRLRTDTSPGAWLIDFSFDEGLYKDSKTVTFSATWRMVTTLSHILLASGIWKKVGEGNKLVGNLWAATMGPISGSTSWLHNYGDLTYDVVVDFGYNGEYSTDLPSQPNPNPS